MLEPIDIHLRQGETVDAAADLVVRGSPFNVDGPHSLWLVSGSRAITEVTLRDSSRDFRGMDLGVSLRSGAS